MSRQDAPWIVGWREYLDLPDLGLTRIKAKVDTGARTSTLHALDIEHFREDGRERVRFLVHPQHRADDLEVVCTADVVDRRGVRSSIGQRQHRVVIETTLALSAELAWPIEVTLTSRSDMRFRMLLGRTALRGHMLVDPGRSYLTGGRPQRIDAARRRRKNR
ncbi:MAG TPA: RimK/LysX family protein [Woeseiaceae bacterium]|nr:RimK/LysX family protein [Woeseiaceae bacterium]